jgi:nitrate/TMAO reductase-like tetraheme cytochrome c subunit
LAFWKKKRNSQNEEEREKKSGLFRRMWRKFRSIDWKNPVNRWRLLFASLFAIVALSGTMWGAIAFTSSPQFCSWCHEMAPEFVTFEASAHSEIKCTQCHIEPGVVNLVTHKVHSLKEVYYHVVGPPDPIVQTVAVTNESCTQCHSTNRLVSATGDLIVNHSEHIQEDIPCITCHSGVAHAKVVERGINNQKDLDYWTLENTEKLVKNEYMKPNMGTCIDCHDKVNKGDRPWEDIQYSLPENPHKDGHGKSEDGHAEAAMIETADAALTTEAKEDADNKKAQEIILTAIGKQKSEAKISMECSTCHLEVSTPKSHQAGKWNQNHGSDAIQELNECIDCHQDSKWIKHFAKEDIVSLIDAGAVRTKYNPDVAVVKSESRDNNFCSSCHSYRPEGHLESDIWLTAHADKAVTKKQKEECFVCHDQAKPQENTKVTAPTDVYCEQCHRTGFKEK